MAKGDSVIDLEKALYVLQRKNRKGEWETQGSHVYRGRTDAITVLQRMRQNHPSEQWRQLLKQEAERYREGWKDCINYVRSTFGLGLENEDLPDEDVVPGSRRRNRDPGA